MHIAIYHLDVSGNRALSQMAIPDGMMYKIFFRQQFSHLWIESKILFNKLKFSDLYVFLSFWEVAGLEIFNFVDNSGDRMSGILGIWWFP